MSYLCNHRVDLDNPDVNYYVSTYPQRFWPNFVVKGQVNFKVNLCTKQHNSTFINNNLFYRKLGNIFNNYYSDKIDNISLRRNRSKLLP